MSIALDGEAINKFVSDAIVESAIGETIAKAIKKTIEDLGNQSYGSKSNPLHSAIMDVVRQAATELIREEYATQIRELVREKLSGERLDKLVDEFVGSLSVGGRGY